MGYAAYSSYKASHIEWGDKIPSHWIEKRMRFLCSITTGDKDTENREENGNYPFYVRADNIESISTYSYDGEAVLTAGDGVGVAKVFHYVNGKFDFHQRVYKFSDFEEVIGKYFFYYMKQNLKNEVLKISAKTTVDSLRTPMFQNFPFVIPSVDEQQWIIKFLDYKTCQIDQLIEKKKALIEKLDEQRVAVITQAVTKGLNENVKMKPSGVEWLGNVPEHWEVRRLKFMASIQNGKDYKDVETEDGGFPVYGSGGAFRKATEYLYDGESVLFGRKGTIDKPLYVNEKFWTVDTMFYSDIYEGTVAKYLFYSALTFQYKLLATQTALPSITQHDLENYLLCFPAIKEQEEIVAYLDMRLEKISQMKILNNKAISKLNEYRSALITSTVTGKINVQNIPIPSKEAC